MIKGAGKTAAGVPVLFLGLSGENVTRLAAGEPIAIRPAELAAMGLPVMEVVLAYGRTEDAIAADLRAAGLLGQELP